VGASGKRTSRFEICVKVPPASLNAFDWRTYRGEPLVMRTQSGFSVKNVTVVGADLAGTVDALGDGASVLRVGDRVTE
jgi:NADPH:quinone reductase-like Zn-dependent oxidoreductase